MPDVRVLGIDPGVTTGVALWDARNGYVRTAFATTDVGEVAKNIDFQSFPLDGDDPLVVVVEGFPGGGPRTREAVTTIKVLGFVEHYAKHLGLRCVVQQPQARLHQVDRARALIGRVRHADDALAHALAYAAAGETATMQGTRDIS